MAVETRSGLDAAPAWAAGEPAAAVDEAPDVSIVMPCLDEIAGVAVTVREAHEALAGLGRSGEVIVVDNGSRDDSPIAAASEGATVVREGRRGYGAAVLRGLASANGGIVVIVDADGSYDFADLGMLLERVAAGADLVVGVRLAGSCERGAMPWLHRRIGTPLLNVLIARLTGRRFRDSQSGFRAMRRQEAMALALSGHGMELASEMLVRAHRAGLRIEETPIRYRRRLGVSKLRALPDGLRHGALLVRMSREDAHSTRSTM